MGFFFWATFIFLSGNARADDLRVIIESAYSKTMNRYFLELSNAAKKNPDAKSFATQVFSRQNDHKELKKLDGLPTPRVILVKDGIDFEFQNSDVVKIRLGAFGEVTVSEGRIKTSADFIPRWLRPIERAEAQWGVAARIGIVAFRLIAGNSARVTAAGTAAGAAGGCYVGVATKYAYETLSQGCSNGALDGALWGATIAGLPFVDNPTEAAIKNGPALRYIKGLGVLGTVAAVTYSAPTLATMNGSILRCKGPKGDFILSAKSEGATRQTLFESFGNYVQFYGPNGPEARIRATEADLKTFLRGIDHFKTLPESHVTAVAQKMVENHENNRQECLKHGEGHTKSESFDSQRRLVEEINKSRSTPVVQ